MLQDKLLMLASMVIPAGINLLIWNKLSKWETEAVPDWLLNLLKIPFLIAWIVLCVAILFMLVSFLF